jgi:hypothetical protein
MNAQSATCRWRGFNPSSKKRDAEVFAHLAFGTGDRMDELAQDGVSCSMCHQISKEKLGTRESFVGGFDVDTTKSKGERAEYRPYKIEDGQLRIMRSSSGGYRPTESDHVRKSELCATCHTLITKALGPRGEVDRATSEQMPYQEWFNSEFKRDAKLSVLPHAGRRGRYSLWRIRSASARKNGPARIRRRQLLYAARAQRYRNETGSDRASAGI